MGKKNVLILALLLLSGCAGSEQEQEIKQYIKAINARKARVIEPVPEFKPLPAFHYPENKLRRNPFKAISEARRTQKHAPDFHRKRQILEQFPLDALKFVGILQQGHRVWGLIQIPKSGEIKRVTSGDYMGRNYGRIRQITPGYLILEERVKRDESWKKRMTKINMHSSAKE